MTENKDKPTIIDGIDVSGCKHFKIGTCLADYLLTDMNFSEAKCELCKNCYYKQLKHKEQECERLRFPMPDTNYAILTKEEFEQLDQLKENLAELKAYKDVNEDFKTAWKELKAENEELKNEIEACYNQVEDFDIIATSKSNKLKQAERKLERIRQVCAETKSVENIKDIYTAKLSGLYLKSRQILQIIDRGNDENL